MTYEILLSSDELDTLGWLVTHGYYPEDAYGELELRDDQPEREDVDRSTELVYLLPEHAAWSIIQFQEDDPCGYLSCCGGRLLGKLVDLEMSIV